MKDTDKRFIGFKSDAAKKSLTIKRFLTNVINVVESDIKLITSTPKLKGRNIMEISFSRFYENAAKYDPNFHITMDHDSGYISHNQESNSNSSLENLTDIITNHLSSKPIYLSEDALLEKPEVSTKFHAAIEKENYEETRNIFNSPDIVIPSSVISQTISYCGFENDSDSDLSIEIPKADQIIIENLSSDSVGVLNSLDVNSDLHCNNSDYSVNINNIGLCGEVSNVEDEYFMKPECVNRVDIVNDKNVYTVMNYSVNKNISSGRYEGYKENDIFPESLLSEENGEMGKSLALNNITNITTGNLISKNNENKKLTLIFSKDNKENIYSVKRKYRSITPDKNMSPDKLNKFLDKSLTPEGNTSTNVDIGPESKSSEKLVIDGKFPQENNVSEQVSPKNPLILEKTEHFEKCVEQVSQESEIIVEDLFSEKCTDFFNNSQCLEKVVTPKKKYENLVDPNISPDLFIEEETFQESIKELHSLNYITEEKYIIKKDHKILKRAQHSLKGVLPPLSVTVIQLSVDEMLNRLESNKEYYWTNDPVKEAKVDEKETDNLNVSNESSIKGEPRSLLITGSFDDCVDKTFPQILKERFHGLHFNRSKLSEEFEEICAKYGQRYVGAETQSTCTVFETNFVSPTKRKLTKQRWAVKSPGRRLSHLARRRITFSSASLQAGVSSVAGSRARQILVDAKKLDLLSRRKSPRKTPKKTPRKSPRIKSRTPSSSAKKKLAMRFRELSGEIENTVPTMSNNLGLSSKRALFVSPDRDKKSSLFLPSTSGLSTFKNESKRPGTKRALFMSPSKNSPLKNSPFKRSPFKRLDLGMEKKRKRSESDDTHPPKLPKISADIRPSESEVKIKCNKTKSETHMSLNRSQAGQNGELSAIHKKKLQWAVYEALRSQNITPVHPQFKIFASVLARVTRKFLPNLTGNAPRPEGGTSDRMLRIARHHVYAVVKGKSVDEIISEYLRNRQKNVKPQGYISIEEFNYEKKCQLATDRESFAVKKDNTVGSLERKKLRQLGEFKVGSENKIDRIRKVINFGDDNR